MDRQKKVRSELVIQMTETAGWGVVLEEMSDMMNDAKSKLLRTDPTDVIGMVKLQERYKTLERFINIINDITKEV